MRSVVAPVTAEIGLCVMLPSILNQVSCWIDGETVVSKPAASSKPASCRTRGVTVLSGSRKPFSWMARRTGLASTTLTSAPAVAR